MDHILSEDDLEEYEAIIPAIPWLGYDHKPSETTHSFDDYALQRGWSAERLTDLKEGRVTAMQQTSLKPFLQSWFSIGLWEAALGKGLEKDSFIKSRNSELMFSSEALQLIVKNLVAYFSIAAEDHSGKVEILKRLMHVLKAASLWNRMLSETQLFIKPNPDFCDDTFHAVMRIFTLLGVTLQYTAEHLAMWVRVPFRSQLQNPWRFTDAWEQRLKERMVERGWCPYIQTMLSPFNVTVQEYAAIIGPPWTRFRHDACSAASCVRHNIDESSYRPLHTRPDCQCAWVRPSLQRIRDILDNGQIPLMDLNKISDADRGKLVEVVPFEPGKTNYCAISHVWSGGLGSTSEEGLPQCAVDMLSGYMEATKGSKLVWIDSLCIPRDRRLRKLSIHTINRVYSQANTTLVLDPELMRTPSPSTRRMLVWITTTAWMQRMWTLPEGGLSRLPYIAFEDGAVPLQQCLADDSSDLHNPVTGALDPHLWGLFSQEVNGLRYIHQSLCYRTTSKREDEVLALAALFDMDTRPILEKTSMDERMALFWMFLKDKVPIPMNIIFLNTPRLPIPGLRWAPSSLLNAGRQLGLIAAPKGIDSYNVQLDDDGTLTGTYVVIRLRKRAEIWLDKFNPIWLTFVPDRGSTQLRSAPFTIETGGADRAGVLQDIDAFAVNVTNIDATTSQSLANELVATVRSVIALTLDIPESQKPTDGPRAGATASTETDAHAAAHPNSHSFKARRRLQLAPIETTGNELMSGTVGWARISIS
ncbi:hypothetical protein A1O1_08886 [Capronia coronata CBS 617.96]|uniref:Heterokaryon incompatibility domain-containing protein n=1 Tax=Capronia coronata CBS 617.96 TaxID=1182541 RepID=W9XNF2_9EURO|nr:uncharacterized protein A1O1_08886 [Capronia coronata CBS 617.96]EXJ78486.1 hypothetical protein A1O1_08886 [Capronia coronata CBS 617.96]